MSRNQLIFLLVIVIFYLSFFLVDKSTAYAQTSGIVYYLSPTGDDANPGTEEQPFKTLNKTRDTVRTVNATMSADINVYLRGGTHTLENTFLLAPQDSGMNGFNIIYRNYPGEAPVLSGGRQITGWVQEGDRWKASVGNLETRQLYINGIKAVRARSSGGLPGGTKTTTGYTTSDTNMQNWGNPRDIEFVDQTEAKLFRCPVDSIIGKNIIMQNPCWSDSQLDTGNPMGLPDWMENAYELLDSPGEWYLNKTTSLLYYIPRSGEDMTTAEIIVPVVETLIKMEGTLDSPVHNLQLQGLTFSYATWLAPSTSRGNPDFWANVALRYVGGQYIGDLAGANVSLYRVQSVKLERNIFTKLGGDGLGIEYGSQDSSIVGNRFYDISGNGIQSGSGENAETDPREVTRNIQIINNYVHDIGREYYSGVAISARLVQDFLISHNEIHDVPSGGITMGWHMDYPINYIKNNKIERNYIRDAMKIMYDGGSIYSANTQPGNVYAFNVVRNQRNDHGGLYLDLGSRYIELSNNISVDNARNLFVNGGDHYIHDNWWQDRFSPYDLWYYQSDFGPNRIENNHVIYDISDTPMEITANAGLESAYLDIKNPAYGEETPPTVTITYPLKNSTVQSGKPITITASATDDVEVTKVEFYIDNSLKCTDATSPYICKWTVPRRRGVNYVIKAKSFDAAGNIAFNSLKVTSK